MTTYLELVEQDNLRMYAAIQRVRELHKKNGIRCNSCGDDRGDYALYPCPTIKALDGEQIKGERFEVVYLDEQIRIDGEQ